MMLSELMFPFERNRYFYGKLLTAADFEAEQCYLNNKRRLLNRLLFGDGVVSGLNVIKADDLSIVIEAGTALDSAGREIVVSQPVVKKLSSLDGFDTLNIKSDESMQSVYLCMSYDETLSEPIHSIAKNAVSDENDGPEHNKIRENYRLFLTDSEPEIHTADEAGRIIRTIWNKDNIRVTVTAPGYVGQGEDFFIETHIDKGSCTRIVSIEYKVELSFLMSEGNRVITIKFDESPEQKLDYYMIKTMLTAASIGMGRIEIKEFRIKIGDTVALSDTEASVDIKIDKYPEEAMLCDMRLLPFGELLGKRRNIYLARIHLILTPEYYIIDKIQTLPFNQTVITALQIQSLRYLMHCKVPTVKNNEKPQVQPIVEQHMRTGTVKVKIPAGASKGEMFYSMPTPHFLGTGTVFLTVGLVKKDEIIFGSITPFENSFIWGTSLDKSSGLFKVGVRLMKSMPLCELEFCWSAVRDSEPVAAESKKLTVYPDICYINPYETVYFEVTSGEKSLKTSDLVWSVSPDEGGRISNKGVFTASGKVGFYEVRVKKASDQSLESSAFVIITED